MPRPVIDSLKVARYGLVVVMVGDVFLMLRAAYLEDAVEAVRMAGVLLWLLWMWSNIEVLRQNVGDIEAFAAFKFRDWPYFLTGLVAIVASILM